MHLKFKPTSLVTGTAAAQRPQVAAWVQCLHVAGLALGRLPALRQQAGADAEGGAFTAQQLWQLVFLPAARHANAAVR